MLPSLTSCHRSFEIRYFLNTQFLSSPNQQRSCPVVEERSGSLAKVLHVYAILDRVGITNCKVGAGWVRVVNDKRSRSEGRRDRYVFGWFATVDWHGPEVKRQKRRTRVSSRVGDTTVRGTRLRLRAKHSDTGFRHEISRSVVFGVVRPRSTRSTWLLPREHAVPFRFLPRSLSPPSWRLFGRVARCLDASSSSLISDVPSLSVFYANCSRINIAMLFSYVCGIRFFYYE